MPRLAAIHGSPGPLPDALAAELTRRGWEVRQVEVSRSPEELAETIRGAELLAHAGIRPPAGVAPERRADLEAAAAWQAGRAAVLAGVRRLLHLSTVSVYGRPRSLPCREGDLKAPRTDFGRARWGAERAAWLAFRHGAPLAVLRPTLTYGPTLKGGPMRTLALFALLAARRRRLPIIRRGPVEHLVHLEDVAAAAAHLAEHPDDRDVVGKAFNVADEAPLPLAEHLAAAVQAMGRSPGRILPYSPRAFAFLLWLVGSIPDRILLDPLNRRLAWAWRRLARRFGSSPELTPRIDREMLHWMSADHYYDVGRLRALGWRARHPLSVDSLPEALLGIFGESGRSGLGIGAAPRA